MTSTIKMNPRQPADYSAAMNNMPAALRPIHPRGAKRRVTFQSSVTVQPVDCKLTDDEKANAYYSKAELDRFSLEVKARVLALRTLSKALPSASFVCDVHAAARDCLVGAEAHPSLRGLEFHLCPSRVKNKALAQKAFLKYERSIKSDPHASREETLRAVAEASRKLTLWSRQVALETARHDSLRAYDVDYRIPVRNPVTIVPFPVTKRRRVTAGDEEEGRPAKRRRF
ncbi:hypothetical protein ACHAXT_001732 [Thalassiosira profunda]